MHRIRAKVAVALAGGATIVSLLTVSLAPTAALASTDGGGTVSTITPKIKKADKKAAERKDDPTYDIYACNPTSTTSDDPVEDRYCFHGNQWKTTAGFALQWSEQHTSKKQRKPVPYPALGTGGGGHLWAMPHTTYVVHYSKVPANFTGPVQADLIWKYGITSYPHYQKRANRGRAACNRWSKSHGYRQVCSRTWVSVNTAPFGWDFGRFMEASLIKDYQRLHKKCPPGQDPSCR